MKNKIYLCFLLIFSLLCGSVLQYFNDAQFIGVGFEYNIIALVFTVLGFVVLSVVVYKRDDCIYHPNNLIRLVRIKSRRTIYIFEIIKIFFLTLFSQTAIMLGIILTCLISKQEISFKYVFLTFIFDFTVKFLLMIIQFDLELSSHSDVSFVCICSLYTLLLFEGIAVYKYITESPDGRYIKLYAIMNKVNIVNYSSYERVLKLSPVYPSFIIILLINIIVIAFSVKFVKKLNILTKE